MKIVFEILVLMGTLIFLSSMFYLRPGITIASLNPKDWWMPKQRGSALFAGPGYRLNRIGLIWMTVGVMGRLAYVFIL